MCFGIAYDSCRLFGTTGGVGFCPLYRERFLGSLATRYVGHSSKACQKWVGTDQTMLTDIPKDLLVICCETNVPGLINECLIRPVM